MEMAITKVNQEEMEYGEKGKGTRTWRKSETRMKEMDKEEEEIKGKNKKTREEDERN
jgi:hypothetical protein